MVYWTCTTTTTTPLTIAASKAPRDLPSTGTYANEGPHCAEVVSLLQLKHQPVNSFLSAVSGAGRAESQFWLSDLRKVSKSSCRAWICAWLLFVVRLSIGRTSANEGLYACCEHQDWTMSGHVSVAFLATQLGKFLRLMSAAKLLHSCASSRACGFLHAEGCMLARWEDTQRLEVSKTV